MPVKTDSKKAIAIMNRAGLKPVEKYSGNIKPWKCKHLKCGRHPWSLIETKVRL
jgi:hypothetical protein